MQQSHKIFIKPNMKMFDLINDNYSLLLLLEHFEIDFAVDDKSIEQICEENKIDKNFFIIIANLYNGFFPQRDDLERLNNVQDIIFFLKNSHRFYKNDKYPEIKKYIEVLKEKHHTKDIIEIERFFNEYFNEVLEHLDYEDRIAFPYFKQLYDKSECSVNGEFSVDDYQEHHTDIETKLTDLKHLLLKHIKIDGDLTIRRKFLNSLFGLEFDLKIHSMIEELILLPIVRKLEKLNG